MSSPDDHRLDRRGLARAFDRASTTYDGAAHLQERVRGELLERLALTRLAPDVIVDLGAGTGHATRELKRRWPRALVAATDIAPGMLEQAKRQSRFLRRFERVCADACRLPFADASVDLVFSSLMLQWCDEPHIAFAEVRRVLRPGGVFTFSTFGPDTLYELRDAWSAADEHSHVNRFTDMPELGDALTQAGLAEPVLDVDRHVLAYADARALMRDLKSIGAHNVTAGRARALTGRGRLRAMEQAYERQRREGSLPATYEVIYGIAFGSAQKPADSAQNGEVRVPIGDIRGRRNR